MEIQYKHKMPRQIEEMIKEAMEKRKSTFPFLVIVDTWVYPRGIVSINFDDVCNGIIYITLDYVMYNQTQRDKVVNWIVSKL